MGKTFNTPDTRRYTPADEWLTPPFIIESLTKALGKSFDVDPCAAVRQPWKTATTQFTKTENGLAKPWDPRLDYWVNPPYGDEASRWMLRLAEQGNGLSILFTRTETQMYQDIIFPRLTGALFLEKRVKFWEQTCMWCSQTASQHKEGGRGCDSYEPSGHAIESNGGNAPSVILAFGRKHADVLKRCSLQGAYLEPVERC